MCGACAEGSSSSTCHACSHPNTALYHVAQGKCCRVPLPRRKNWLFQYRTAVAGRTSSESSRCVPWWMYSVFPSLINGSKNSLTFRIESLKGWALSQCGQRRQDPQSRVAVPRRKEPWLPPCGFRSATWARAPSALGEELPLGVWVICLQCRNSESFAYDFNLSNSRACPYAWVWLEPPERAGQLGWAGPLRAGGSHCLGTGRGLGQWRLQDTPGLAASGGCQGKADVGGCSLPSQAAGQEGRSWQWAGWRPSPSSVWGGWGWRGCTLLSRTHCSTLPTCSSSWSHVNLLSNFSHFSWQNRNSRESAKLEETSEVGGFAGRPKLSSFLQHGRSNGSVSLAAASQACLTRLWSAKSRGCWRLPSPKPGTAHIIPSRLAGTEGLEERAGDVRLVCVGCRRREGWGFSMKGEAANRGYS